MNSQRHIIKRQIIEITTDSQLLAQRAQTQISQLASKQILKLIEQHCSRLSDANTLHRIELMELDLGTLTIENLQKDLSKALDRQLKKQLPRYLIPHKNGHFHQHQQTDNTTETLLRQNTTTSQLELFNYFARTGHLPWWVDTQNQHILEDCLKSLLEKQHSALRQQLRKFIDQQQPLLRLIQHYDDSELRQLFALLESTQQNILLQIINKLSASIPQSNAAKQLSTKQIRQAIWFSAFQLAANPKQSSYSESTCINTLLHLITKQLAIPFVVLHTELQAIDQSIFSTIEPSLDSAPNFTKLLQKLYKTPKNIQLLDEIYRLINKPDTPQFFVEQSLMILQTIKPAPSDSALFIQRLASILALNSTATEKQFNQAQSKQKDKPSQNFSSADEIYLNNAGLIILWPFLQRFFNTLQWLHNKQFINQQTQQQALTALHYIATGEVIAQEFMLVLNKLLCGMPIDSLYQPEQPLKQAELSACDELLAAVIAHAPILKNTSINGFRSSFIIRPGVLSQRDGLWLLRVERQTHDLLLDRLPWSFEWFKLPWMPLAMRVEW